MNHTKDFFAEQRDVSMLTPHLIEVRDMFPMFDLLRPPHPCMILAEPFDRPEILRRGFAKRFVNKREFGTGIQSPGFYRRKIGLVNCIQKTESIQVDVEPAKRALHVFTVNEKEFVQVK